MYSRSRRTVLGSIAAFTLASRVNANDGEARAAVAVQEDELAPGLTEDGVEDPIALAEAHRDTLLDTSRTMEVEDTRAADETTLVEIDETTEVEEGTFPVLHTSTVGGDDPVLFAEDAGTTEIWSDEGEHVVRTTDEDGEESYEAVSRPSGIEEDRTRWTEVNVVFESTEVEIIDEDESGEYAVYELESTGEFDPPSGAAFADADEFSLTARVDERGVVREYAISYDDVIEIEDEEERVDVEQTVSFVELGETSVEQPGWYDEAWDAAEEEDGQED